MPFSPWELAEHTRVARQQILELSLNPDFDSPSWPVSDRPETAPPPHDRALDRRAIQIPAHPEPTQPRVTAGPPKDLFKPFPHDDGRTLLRQALLAAGQNAPHLEDSSCRASPRGALGETVPDQPPGRLPPRPPVAGGLTQLRPWWYPHARSV